MIVQCERIYSCDTKKECSRRNIVWVSEHTRKYSNFPEVVAIHLRACMPFMLFISSQYNTKDVYENKKQISM